MRAQFVLSEIGIGLRRHLLMTISVIITIAVSLTFVGFAALFYSQVETMKGYWYDRVEVSVYLCGANSVVPSCEQGEVTQAQREEVQATLESLSQVEQIYFESKQEAFGRFQEQFEGTAIAENATVEAMPESFRVALVDPEQFEIVASALDGRPGVEEVQDQKALLQPFFDVLRWLTTGSLVLAAVMLAVAVIMTVLTIQLAAHSRRRETGIMRLVGASNLYIRLPFILEGAIAGLAGGILAAGAVAAFHLLFVQAELAPNFQFTRFIEWGDVWPWLPLLLVLGGVLGGTAAFATLQRYLRV